MEDIPVDTSILAIGDIHFRTNHLKEGEELTAKCIETARIIQPTMIVLLGDILDTHEVARNGPYKMACSFIEQLAEIAETYVLMGNHDLINGSQFLTDNHFFGPLKKWENVTIVDVPISVSFPSPIEDRPFDFIMCPYVPPGRFIEALGTFDNDHDWKSATCIFAHQEFRGVVIGSMASEVGDDWDPSYPQVISGHIHTSQVVGNNIHYTGSALQINFDEDFDKKIWHITFDDDLRPQIDGISLGLKSKKDIVMPVEDVKKFDTDMCSDHYIRLKLTGTSEQFKVFRKSPTYTKLSRLGVKMVFDRITKCEEKGVFEDLTLATRDQTSFEGVLREVIKNKKKSVRDAYNRMYGTCENIVYELVFVGADGQEV